MTKFADLKTKTARIAFIKSQLSTNVVWATRALIRIYEFQTADEKAASSTHHYNNVGFNGADAEILSSFAQQVNKGWTLSQKQVDLLHKKMPKYARQLEKLTQQ